MLTLIAIHHRWLRCALRCLLNWTSCPIPFGLAVLAPLRFLSFAAIYTQSKLRGLLAHALPPARLAINSSMFDYVSMRD